MTVDLGEPQPPNCYRCGQPAHVEWFVIQSFGGGTLYLVDEQWCVTPGCVDEHGSRSPVAPTPRELSIRADRLFLDRQRRLVEEP